MLYGNLIFIKKTGGDGSKFPVTQKDVKIGRSQNCLIRIYNPEVAPEHCQLIIKDIGQATLRSLSSHTVLNGKPLGQGDTILRHGDVFQIGTRSARWEYFPHCTQALTPTAPTGRQVAIVMPQQRSSGEWATPGTSTSQVSALRNTPLGKRTYSERSSESSPAVKIRKSSGYDLLSKNKGDLLKLLTGRHSFKSTKLLLHGAKIKHRKSISGMAGTKTPAGKAKGNSRKSTLPSWKVNVASPPERASKEHRNSLAKSVRKSTKSRKSVVKTPLKNIESRSEKLLSTPESEIKATQRTPVESKLSEGIVKSASKSVSKSSLKAAAESTSRKNESPVKSTRSLSKSPSPRKLSVKSPSKAVFSTPRQKHPKLSKPVHSESKVNLRVLSREKRTMSLILNKSDSPSSVIKSKEKEKISNSKSSGESVADTAALPSLKTNLINESTAVQRTPRKSDFTRLKNTPAKSSKKSPVKKSGGSPAQIRKKTPRKSVITKTLKSPSPRRAKASAENSEISSSKSNDAPSAKKRKFTPRKSVSANNSPARKTPVKLVQSVDKLVSSTNKKFSRHTIPSLVDLQPDPNQTPQSGRKSSGSKISSRKSTKASPSPKGVRRKLSPNSDAERAAKKLKTSNPKKPDKNKKKALLVLGIASRKQLLSQNVKVLLKRKIVKKAIKQSTAVAGLQDVIKKKTVPKVSQKKISKSTKKSTTVKKPSQSPKASVVKSPVKEKTPKSKKVLETSQLNSSAQESSINLPLTSEKSPSKQKKKSDMSGLSLLSKSYASESPFSFEQSPENYLFNSNRRCSKRLSSKNETDRPDFIELCPTALGLIPKNIEVFKTPKVNKRKSITLSTPKNVQSSGIIKSASTSKIGNRKSVRFSSKDVSFNSEMRSPNITENTPYDFTPIQTPNVSVDVFVSPLTDKSNVMKKDVNDSAVKTDDIFKPSAKARKSNSDPATCARKLLLSPSPEKSLDKVSSVKKSLTRSSRITASQSPSPAKVMQQSKAVSSGNLNNLEVVLYKIPNIQKSPKNSLSDLEGVANLLRTPRDMKSPKNDLADVRGVKKLFQTPKAQNSPKNDLTDVRGIKRLLKTPKEQKSPKNDLSDVRGVKRLLKTPREQRSPKNDLSDVRGVKRLLKTPREQRSPKNDLSDVRGVKKLLTTPKTQKSPKNDLSDLRGVKKLMQSPKVQKSPKNDLSDLRGVKKLMQSPKVQKSPKNDLSNVAGVKRLLRTPRVQKSPRNELSDLRGVKKLLGSPRVQKSPKNELNDLTGVKALFTTPRVQESPRNNLLDVSGVAKLFEPLSAQKLSRNSTEGTKEVTKSLKSEETFNDSMTNVTGVKQLLISKNMDSGSKNKKVSGKKITDYRAIRGRRVIYSTPRGPKNDLSDPTGVRELFLRHKPNCNFDISLTGVAELFELPKTEANPSKSESETASEAKQKRSKAIKSKEKSETEVKITARGSRLRKVVIQEPPKRARSDTSQEADLKEKKTPKRKASEEMKKSQAKRANVKSAKSETKSSRSKTKGKTSEEDEETKVSRKRKAQVETPEASPPKLRRRVTAAEANSAATKSGSSRRTKSEANKEKKTAVRSVKKAPAKATTTAKTSKVQSKPITKTATKQASKVQKRSQTSTKAKTSASAKTPSPRKTRSTKATATVQRKVSKTSSVTGGKKTVKSAQAERKKASPEVKRSTRRK